MASNCPLLGPPEVNKGVSASGSASASAGPQLGFTENNSLTYKATGNPCLDFFFHVVPDTCPKSIMKRLEKAWDHDPLTTLKLICNLRAIRGTGKSHTEGFFSCAIWLFKHHPWTLAYNLKSIVEFGCFKDLLEILYRLLEGQDIRSKRKSEWESRKSRGGKVRKKRKYDNNRRVYNFQSRMNNVKVKVGSSKEDRIRKNLERGEEEKKAAKVLRQERKAAKAKKALGRYKQDPDFRVLHDQVAEVFAKFLRFDLALLKLGETNKISLASKWCPNLDSSYDKTTLICESIARRVFPKAEYSEYEGIEDAHYAYRVRDRLRKEVLVSLHKALELPEVYIGANQWASLPYNRVPSVAMKTYRDLFLKHDPKRFLNYLEDVKKGDSTIASGGLLPHEIIASLGGGCGSSVAELQWRRMVEDVTKLGRLKGSVAVCDVSGSMEGTPMEVCVALGLLISELSEDPWKGKVITFSEDPKFHVIKGDDLKSKVEFVKDMDYGRNTNFQKVFDRILKVAVENKISQDEMVKRVFVFSDMEFDEAAKDQRRRMYTFNSFVIESDSSSSSSSDSESSYYYGYGYCKRRREEKGRKERVRAEKCRRKGWTTDYEAIKRKYKEKGFEKEPEIVFWNLRSSEAIPVTATQEGVMLLSGFSKNLMKLFFEKDGVFSPLDAMELAIAGDEYKELIVYD